MTSESGVFSIIRICLPVDIMIVPFCSSLLISTTNLVVMRSVVTENTVVRNYDLRCKACISESGRSHPRADPPSRQVRNDLIPDRVANDLRMPVVGV